MHPADLLRRTSFRLAISVALFLLVALFITSAIGYTVMRGRLIVRQESRITETFAALQKTGQEGEEQDLVDAFTTRITASRNHDTLYLLKNQDGKVLAANMPDIALKPGWSLVAPENLGIQTDFRYRVFAGKTGPYTIVVGLTDADLDDLREIVVGAFGWSALIALATAVGAGAVLAAQVQRRIAQVEAALQRVALGDLSARLQVTPRGDDLDQIATAINDSLSRLQALVEAMRQVSADIAHDLRTPLNRLRIHIEDAARKIARGGSADGELEAAITQCETIGETFSALLRIAQIETGARREKFSSLDLAAVLGGVAEVYEDVADDAGMHLTCRGDQAAWVHGDKELLTQMFANLIENAIRHCPAGTAISCSTSVQGDRVCATISDSGPGIPDDERDRVLRRLYRLEKSRTTEGSGLGLALVKAVADLHGAELALSDASPGLRIQLVFHRGPAIP